MGSSSEQSRLWGAGAKDYAEIQEGIFIDLFRAVADQVLARSEIALLDIGCGSGIFCQMAARRGARISGFDATEPLLEIARQRVPEGDFRLGEMEELPYADGTFDVVTGLNSLQFADSPLNAAREARRVAQPDGRVAIAVFGQPEEVETVAIMRAIGALMAELPSVARRTFALSAAGTLEALAVEAGLVPEYAGEMDCLWRYPDQETIVRGFLSPAPSVVAIQQAGEQAVREAIVRASAPFKTRDGGYVLKNKARYLVARPG